MKDRIIHFLKFGTFFTMPPSLSSGCAEAYQSNPILWFSSFNSTSRGTRQRLNPIQPPIQCPRHTTCWVARCRSFLYSGSDSREPHHGTNPSGQSRHGTLRGLGGGIPKAAITEELAANAIALAVDLLWSGTHLPKHELCH